MVFSLTVSDYGEVVIPFRKRVGQINQVSDVAKN